ncbi:MAG TPA: hypothetical protein VFO18_16615 [Methylomirabilota bacterium]|nr:hypothetical protein [Methylomirabilota bacterium]
MGAVPTDPRQTQRTAAVISAAMITSVVMYGVVVNLFRITAPGPFEGFVRLPEVFTVRVALWGVTAIVLAGIPLVRRALLTRRPGEDPRAGAARLATAAVVTNALAEIPALLGFILVVLNGLYLDFYVLAGLSVLEMLMYFPRSDAWEEWLKQRP